MNNQKKINLSPFMPLAEGKYTNCLVKDIVLNFDDEDFENESLLSMDVTFSIDGRKLRDRFFGTNDFRFQAFLVVLKPFMDEKQSISMEDLVQRTLSLGVENYNTDGRTYPRTRDWKFDKASPMPTSIQAQNPGPEFDPNNIGY